MATGADLLPRIASLKKRRNAVILSHNYQRPEVQDLADLVGDSLELSRAAARAKADVIVFCGVHFMAETAAILSPGKTVLIPDPASGCPMADMISADQLRAFKKDHPGAPVVAYVNTSAAVKAESDICCTSANAVRIVDSLPDETILFVPDRNLGAFVQSRTKKKLIFWPGYCHVHMRFLPEHITRARGEHPGAEVLVHPECMPAVTALADHVLSTSGMCRHARESASREFIIATEAEILHRMRKENQGKRFYPALEAARCDNMKKNSPEKLLWSLEEMKHVVSVPPEVRVKALRAVERMIAL